MEESYCDTLFHCFWSIIIISFRNGEGLGGILTVYESFQNPTNRGMFFGKEFLSIAFFLVINVVLLNIIFGIIVDTFA